MFLELYGGAPLRPTQKRIVSVPPGGEEGAGMVNPTYPTEDVSTVAAQGASRHLLARPAEDKVIATWVGLCSRAPPPPPGAPGAVSRCEADDDDGMLDKQCVVGRVVGVWGPARGRLTPGECNWVGMCPGTWVTVVGFIGTVGGKHRDVRKVCQGQAL